MLTSTPYLYYQVDVSASDGGTNVGFAELEILGPGGIDVLRDVTDAGVASATSSYEGGYGTPNAAFRFTPDTDNFGWMTGGLDTGRLTWASDAAVELVGAVVQGYKNEPGRAPKDFTIIYSDNGSSWTVAKTVTGQVGWSTTVNEGRYFSWPSVGAHRYWAIDVTATQAGAGYLRIYSLMLSTVAGQIIGLSPRAAYLWGSSSQDSANTPANLIDGSISTDWVAQFNVWPQQVNALLGRPVAAEAIRIRAKQTGFNYAPKDLIVRGKNAVGDSWTTLGTFTGSTGWTASEQRTFGLDLARRRFMFS